MRRLFAILLLFLSGIAHAQPEAPYIQVLGVAQDGGYPHTGCEKACCASAWADPAQRKWVVALALVDPASHNWWLFEATPDIKEQLHYFHTVTGGKYNYLPTGIFVTHAHIGHYTGLMQLGREVMNTKNVAVYAMPRMKKYIENNGPWSQLVNLQNISLQTLHADSSTTLQPGISITPIIVPHRDEYSETLGFSIVTPARKYLFIPDINKWDLWNRSITEEVKTVDIALVDATCYDNGELPGRNMKVIQHPNVVETMALFDTSPAKEKAKIYFIHMNHTNPLLWNKDKQQEILGKGYHIAQQGEKL